MLAEGRWYLGGVGRVIASSSVAVLELARCGGMKIGLRHGRQGRHTLVAPHQRPLRLKNFAVSRDDSIGSL